MRKSLFFLKQNLLVLFFGVLVSSFILTFISINFEGSYSVIVGNMCSMTESSPHGECYDDLPVRGFPLGYWHDYEKVKHHLDADEIFIFPYFLLNFLFFFVCQIILLLVLNKFFKFKWLINVGEK